MAIHLVDPGRGWGPERPQGPLAFNGAPGIARGLIDTAIYRSQADMTVTMRGNVYTPESSPLIDGLGFAGNGTADILSRTTPTVTAIPISLSAWIVPATASPAADEYFLSEGDVAAFGALVGLRQVAGGAQLGYAIRVVASGTLISLNGGACAVNQPCHVVGVSAAVDQHFLYVNGVLVDVDGSAVTQLAGAWDNTIVGAVRRDTTTNFYTGHIQQWAIWNRALSAGEAWSLWEARTRWDMYRRPGRRAAFSVGTAFDAALFPRGQFEDFARRLDRMIPSGRIA
jgi:hypothetical protein